MRIMVTLKNKDTRLFMYNNNIYQDMYSINQVLYVSFSWQSSLKHKTIL